MVAGLIAVATYGRYVPTVAPPASIGVPTGAIPSEVTSARGLQIGGLERGARAWTSFGEMSPDFVRAIVASEDARFFVHEGFDLEAIARAAVANRAAGGVTQGGSTLTQQLAKSFVGDEESLARKLEELVVARRIEVLWSKAAIFEAYANRIYFGAGATGVGAAAAIYFGRTPAELTLAQSAMLAAILPAPGRFHPFREPELVRERRDRVLDRLEATGLATADEVAAARAEDLGLSGVGDVRVTAPGLERAAWRSLATMSDADWRRRDLRIHTGFDLVRQRVAEAAVREHLEALDQRQGWRGPAGHVAAGAEAAFDAALAQSAPGGRVRVGRVEAVSRDAMSVRTGSEATVLGPDAWSWAAPYAPDGSEHDATVSDARDVASVGDIVLLADGRLTQWPRVEAAYAALDLATGHYEALVGGYDAARSEFDRVVQGCRQPGSTFKPIVYSVALDAGYTPASALRDAPIRIELGPYEEWRPRNADGAFDGHLTVWEALIWSRNLPALQLYRELGSAATIRRARELGISSRLDAVESLALGASCLSPEELLRVYGALGRTGFALVPRVVDRVVAPDGAVWVSGPAIESASVPVREVVSRWWRDRGRVPEPVLHTDTAFQTSWLLRQVVLRGTGRPLRERAFEVAGKTGTTNAYDAWFAGYTDRDVAVTWIGSDRNERPLGDGETGGELALPLWDDALLDPAVPGPVLAEPPTSIVWAEIEPESGWLAAEDRWAIEMPFRRGTEPRRQAPSQVVRDLQRIDRIERGDLPL